MILTQQHLRELFDYIDGELIWKIRRPKVVIGTSAGRLNVHGRWTICVYGKHYYRYRLIWAWHHGEMPIGDIDHIDLNKANDKIENLREATRSQNLCNKLVRSDSGTGIKGVGFHKATGKFRARVQINGKSTYIGLFDSEKDAAVAYASAAKQIQREFARPQ